MRLNSASSQTAGGGSSIPPRSPSGPAAGLSLPIVVTLRLDGEALPLVVRLSRAGKAIGVKVVGPVPKDAAAAVCTVNAAIGGGRRTFRPCRSGLVGAVAEVVRRCERDHAPVVAMAYAAADRRREAGHG